MTSPSAPGPERDGAPRRWLLVVALTVEAGALPREHPALAGVVITGIGKVNAAAGVARRLARAECSGGLEGLGVLNVGTCGGLRGGVGRLVRPSEARTWDFGTRVPRALPEELPRTSYPLVLGDGSVIATGDSFVADGSRREELARSADVVDMECAALAQACHQVGVPVAALKWISDGASEGASDVFARTVDRGARELGAATRAFLDACA